VSSFLRIIPLTVRTHLSIHNLGIIPGEYLIFPTKEQDYAYYGKQLTPCIMISFMNGTPHQMLFGSKKFDMNEIVGECSTCTGRERRGACRVLVRKFEGKRPLGRSRLRWEDNIKTDLK